MANRPVLVIHGGCGLIARSSMTAEYERACREVLKKSLQTGYDILKSGGSAVDAVVAAVVVMEDSEYFNAGKGSVFTLSSTNELDAGVMDGSTGKAGGCTALTRVKNPILLARHIMESTPHTILSGPGAEAFAEKQGLTMVDPRYFYTDRRFEQLQRVLKSTEVPKPQLDHNVDLKKDGEKDTVGAVAVDISGRLAASSSTGGLTGKMVGRQSDSSVPGAGFWADSKVAYSMTGDGDYFLRRTASHEMASMVKYTDASLEEAAKKTIFEILGDCHAGVIGVDADGKWCMPYNSEGMYRGYVDCQGNMEVHIWEY